MSRDINQNQNKTTVISDLSHCHFLQSCSPKLSCNQDKLFKISVISTKTVLTQHSLQHRIQKFS